MFKSGGAVNSFLLRRSYRRSVSADCDSCRDRNDFSAVFRISVLVCVVERSGFMKIVVMKVPKCLRGIVKAMFKM